MSPEVQPGPAPDVVLGLAIALVVTLLFIEHARHAFIDWRELRTAQSLRILIIAVALVSSLVSATATQAYRAGLLPLDVTVWAGTIIRGALVVAGLFDVVSWHLDRRARRRRRSLDTDE